MSMKSETAHKACVMAAYLMAEGGDDVTENDVQVLVWDAVKAAADATDHADIVVDTVWAGLPHLHHKLRQFNNGGG